MILNGPSRNAQLWVALALTAVIVGFHAVRACKAGGLWRDEAAAVQLATLPRAADVIRYFPHEAFPLLFPATVRVYAWLTGNHDAAWRLFGFLVGTLIIGALWWNTWTIRRRVPLLSLALLGFNGAFIRWGDSVRGYGLGMVFLLMTVGLVWRVVEGRDELSGLNWLAGWGERVGLAMLGAVCSVQCVLANSVFLLALCLGGMAAVWWNGREAASSRRPGSIRGRRVRPAFWPLWLIGGVAAVSLLPYWGLLGSARDWDILVRIPFSLWQGCSALDDALGASGWWTSWIWAALAATTLFVVVRGLIRQTAAGVEEDSRVLVYCGVILIAAVAAYAGFLEILQYSTQPWYYVTLMALAALMVDLVFTEPAVPAEKRAPVADSASELESETGSITVHRRALSWLRPALALVIGLTSLLPTWKQLQTRQTNMDLTAARLNATACREDLIVVTPWHYGISLERYYRGAAPWITVPLMDFHKFHRYDLMKSFMLMPDQDEPVRPIEDRVRDTLKAGHRVWVLGDARSPKAHTELPTVSAAPDERWGWQYEAYCFAWSAKLTAYLEVCASKREEVGIQSPEPISPLESPPLAVFQGWAGL